MNWFRRDTPEALAARQLEEARMAELLHTAAAEAHHATAVMFRQRIERLEGRADGLRVELVIDPIDPVTLNQPRKETP